MTHPNIQHQTLSDDDYASFVASPFSSDSDLDDELSRVSEDSHHSGSSHSLLSNIGDDGEEYSNEEYYDNNNSSHMGRNSRRYLQSKRRRKISRNFTAQEFIELMHLSQRDAAKQLNVCLSTFKRQFSAVRPKLQWPTPSQRKVLIHRRRFQNIIEQNQEEIFPSTQFEFGKNNDHIYDEILPDPKVLSEECAQLKRIVESLQRENRDLKEQLFRQSMSPPASPVVAQAEKYQQTHPAQNLNTNLGHSNSLVSTPVTSMSDFLGMDFSTINIQPQRQTQNQANHQRFYSLSDDLMEPSFQLAF